MAKDSPQRAVPDQQWRETFQHCALIPTPRLDASNRPPRTSQRGTPAGAYQQCLYGILNQPVAPATSILAYRTSGGPKPHTRPRQSPTTPTAISERPLHRLAPYLREGSHGHPSRGGWSGRSVVLWSYQRTCERAPETVCRWCLSIERHQDSFAKPPTSTDACATKVESAPWSHIVERQIEVVWIPYDLPGGRSGRCRQPCTATPALVCGFSANLFRVNLGHCVVIPQADRP